MQSTAEPTGRRLALVIGASAYADPTLQRLRAPGRDAQELATVLQDAAIGRFDVATVLDQPSDVVRRRIAQFCAAGGPRDTALLYLSCHGVLDDRGRLYYASTDTERAWLSVSAIPAQWLNEQLEDCRCRRQLVILDCCHSGAFAKGAKGESPLALGERFEGRGRVVLTASRATEYSFEGDDVVGNGVSSVFTSALVRGLRTGDADTDKNGLVTVNELYNYAYDSVRRTEARQTPALWTYGAEGDLVVARSPRGAVVDPIPLPEDLQLALDSPRPTIREGAVEELARLLDSPQAGLALSARETLQRVAAEDVPRVAARAREILGEPAPAAAAATVWAAPAPPRPQPRTPQAPPNPQPQPQPRPDPKPQQPRTHQPPPAHDRRAAADLRPEPRDSAGQRWNALAIASLALSCIWFYGIGSIIGIILGNRARKQIAAGGNAARGRGLALWGVIVGWGGLAVMALALIAAAAGGGLDY